MTIYFAWVAHGLTAFGVTHHRHDENVFSFEVRHQEGNPASLSLDIKNPRVGLLTPARDQWAWLSWRKPDNSVVALFHGRLVGVPEDMGGEIVRLLFLGVAPTTDAQKEALAQNLRVLPYFDPVFIARDRIHDPDTVLEARSAVYHFGRTDKTVTISDILDGEDGEVEFGPGDDDWPIFDLSFRYKGTPLRFVDVEAEVDWKQHAEGSIDVSDRLASAFRAAGSSGAPITSYTGEGLEATWFEAGENGGGGWSVLSTRLNLLSGNGVTPTFIDAKIKPSSTEQPPYDDASLGGDTTNPVNKARFYKWAFSASLQLAYEASRDRAEKLSFTLTADVQDLLDASSQPKREALSFQSSEVAEFVDDIDSEDEVFTGERRPIGDPRAASYFNQDRGRQSVRFLILVARAKLMMAARAAEIALETSFEAAVELSCRKNGAVVDPRLPGGGAIGKVTAYRFGLDGDDGRMFGDLVLGSAIGEGEAFTVEGGDPTVWEEGVYEANVQVYSDQEIELVGGTIGAIKFNNYDIPPVDDGVNFSNMTVAQNVQSLQVFNGETAQAALLEGGPFNDIADAVNQLNDIHTRVEIVMRPLTGGPFRAEFPVTVAPMVLPKHIDLEAA